MSKVVFWKLYWKLLTTLLNVYHVSGLGAVIQIVRVMSFIKNDTLSQKCIFKIDAKPGFFVEIGYTKDGVRYIASGEMVSQNGPEQFQPHSEACGFFYFPDDLYVGDNFERHFKLI